MPLLDSYAAILPSADRRLNHHVNASTRRARPLATKTSRPLALYVPLVRETPPGTSGKAAQRGAQSGSGRKGLKSKRAASNKQKQAMRRKATLHMTVRDTAYFEMAPLLGAARKAPRMGASIASSRSDSCTYESFRLAARLQREARSGRRGEGKCKSLRDGGKGRQPPQR